MSASNLVVVESPSKAKTIKKYLGSDFQVKASMGHIKDLPKSRLGVDVEKNFEPQYGVLRGRTKLLKELKTCAKGVNRVYLATDPDREGEAIAWHLAAELKAKGNTVQRVRFHEITASAVRTAVENSCDLDMNLVNAQQARRVLDRLVGYSLSPLLWRRVRKGLSAGRVQSVALRLVVDREREIRDFKPQEYWELWIELDGRAGGAAFKAKLWSLDGVKLETLNEVTAQKLAPRLAQGIYHVASVQTKEQRRNPPAPYTTSSLQQDAAHKLHFSAKKTMLLAQQLYEGLDIGSHGTQGLITYMRTDSVRIAEEAKLKARAWILEHYGNDYAPKRFNTFRGKKGAQDAHEAIRPTSLKHDSPELSQYLSPDQLKLYRMIRTRFLASQMTIAVFDKVSVEIDAKFNEAPQNAGFKATGSVLKFPGFLIAYGADLDLQDEENELPPMKKGQDLKYRSHEASQHFTQGPPRFNDASLIKLLEELGIGRPSTYASILSTILDRGYVERIEGGRFRPTDTGLLVTDLLVEHFQDLMNVQFTAEMELKLDQVALGELTWQGVVSAFYAPFSASLALAKERMPKMKLGAKLVPQGEQALEELCDKCGKPLVIKLGRFGRFIGCSGYPVCRNTRAIPGQKKFKKRAA